MAMMKYMNFINEHGRSYASKDHFDTRFQIFSDNLSAIEDHNSSEAPFALGVNEFSDLTQEEFLQMHTTSLRPKRTYHRLKTAVDSGDSWHPDYTLDDYILPED